MEQKYGWLAVISIIILCLAEPSELLNWTEQPNNPTEAIKGQSETLTWRYSLTSGEQTSSQTSFLVKWSKLNDSSSQYDQIVSYFKISEFDPSYMEKAPHIVIDRATGTSFASLQINDVRIDDEGIYKIEISFQIGVVAADHEVNLTVSDDESSMSQGEAEALRRDAELSENRIAGSIAGSRHARLKLYEGLSARRRRSRSKWTTDV